ncbi:uncharacterized protein CC84DRAFT_1208608, partial [Paraphaeosphaeria sporulosa]
MAYSDRDVTWTPPVSKDGSMCEGECNQGVLRIFQKTDTGDDPGRRAREGSIHGGCDGHMEVRWRDERVLGEPPPPDHTAGTGAGPRNGMSCQWPQATPPDDAAMVEEPFDDLARQETNHSAASPRCILFFACMKRLCDAARPMLARPTDQLLLAVLSLQSVTAQLVAPRAGRGRPPLLSSARPALGRNACQPSADPRGRSVTMAAGLHPSASPTISWSDIGDLAQVRSCSPSCHPQFAEGAQLLLSLTPPAQRHTHISGTRYPKRGLALLPHPYPHPSSPARPYYYTVWPPPWRVGPFLLRPSRLMLSHPNVAVPTLTSSQPTQPTPHASVSTPACTRPHLHPKTIVASDAVCGQPYLILLRSWGSITPSPTLPGSSTFLLRATVLSRFGYEPRRSTITFVILKRCHIGTPPAGSAQKHPRRNGPRISLRACQASEALRRLLFPLSGSIGCASDAR